MEMKIIGKKKHFTARTLVAWVLFLISATGMMAQQSVKWLEKDYDFGVWKEISGPRTGVSRFINISNDSISILDVKPSCGCTSATYSDHLLAPGDTATVTYTYDPEGRPGRFSKSVKMALSTGEKYAIRITGSVIGTPESLRILYPIEAGHIFLTPIRQPEDRIIFGNTTSYFVNAYNESPDSINPVARTAVKGVKVERAKGKIGPGDVATFGIYFDTRAHGEMGPVDIPIEFVADSLNLDAGSVVQTLHAMVLPDTSHLSGDAGLTTPRISTDPEIVDLGNLSAEITKFSFQILNDGGNPLKIYRIYPEEEYIEIIKTPKGDIKHGKKGKVECRFDSSLLSVGPFRHNVSIITNDPIVPIKKVRVVGIK
jgi:hypothetical protein